MELRYKIVDFYYDLKNGFFLELIEKVILLCWALLWIISVAGLVGSREVLLFAICPWALMSSVKVGINLEKKTKTAQKQRWIAGSICGSGVILAIASGLLVYRGDLLMYSVKASVLLVLACIFYKLGIRLGIWVRSNER